MKYKCVSILKSSLLTPTVTLVDQAFVCMLYYCYYYYFPISIYNTYNIYMRYAAFYLNKYFLCVY